MRGFLLELIGHMVVREFREQCAVLKNTAPESSQPASAGQTATVKRAIAVGGSFVS